MMKKISAGFVAALLAFAPALAQNAGTVTNHAYAIGKGPGISGYTSLLCASGQLAIGSATDPTCRTMSGDATLSAVGALTLATVNANVGTFGSATQAPQVTVNAKGLTTAAVNVTVTPAVGSITGLGAGCATFLGTPSSANLRGCMTDESGTGLAYFQGGDLGTPSAGVVTNLTGTAAGLTAGTFTAGSATNLTSGTLPAVRMPALTGDVTSTVGTVATTLAAGSASNLNSGTLAVARGGVDQTAWTAYTPTCVFSTPGTSVIGTVVGRWKQIGKIIFFVADCTIGTVGTGTGNLVVGLPATNNGLNGIVAASGKEVITQGWLLAIGGGTTTVNVLKYDNASLATGGNGTRAQISGTYEAN